MSARTSCTTLVPPGLEYSPSGRKYFPTGYCWATPAGPGSGSFIEECPGAVRASARPKNLNHIYIGKYDLSIIRKPILPLTSWDPPGVTLDSMRPPGCPPLWPLGILNIPLDPLEPLDLLDPLDPLDPLGPLGPLDLLGASRSPVLPYKSSEDLSNVTVDPTGHPRRLSWPAGIPEASPLTSHLIPRPKMDYKSQVGR